MAASGSSRHHGGDFAHAEARMSRSRPGLVDSHLRNHLVCGGVAGEHLRVGILRNPCDLVGAKSVRGGPIGLLSRSSGPVRAHLLAWNRGDGNADPLVSRFRRTVVRLTWVSLFVFLTCWGNFQLRYGLILVPWEHLSVATLLPAPHGRRTAGDKSSAASLSRGSCCRWSGHCGSSRN